MIVLCDLCVYCFFVGPVPDMVERTAKLINARWGTDISFEKAIEIPKKM